ncbi:MAG: hypothetical protein ACTHOR_01825 [Devosia sp.]
MSDVKELIERLRASGTANAPRDGGGIHMSICDKAASAIERLISERDEAREALRPFAQYSVVAISAIGSPATHYAISVESSYQPTFEHFRRARAALSTKETR